MDKLASVLVSIWKTEGEESQLIRDSSKAEARILLTYIYETRKADLGAAHAETSSALNKLQVVVTDDDALIK
jgi:hypothetical protein